MNREERIRPLLGNINSGGLPNASWFSNIPRFLSKRMVQTLSKTRQLCVLNFTRTNGIVPDCCSYNISYDRVFQKVENRQRHQILSDYTLLQVDASSYNYTALVQNNAFCLPEFCHKRFGPCQYQQLRQKVTDSTIIRGCLEHKMKLLPKDKLCMSQLLRTSFNNKERVTYNTIIRGCLENKMKLLHQEKLCMFTASQLLSFSGRPSTTAVNRDTDWLLSESINHIK